MTCTVQVVRHAQHCMKTYPVFRLLTFFRRPFFPLHRNQLRDHVSAIIIISPLCMTDRSSFADHCGRGRIPPRSCFSTGHCLSPIQGGERTEQDPGCQIRRKSLLGMYEGPPAASVDWFIVKDCIDVGLSDARRKKGATKTGSDIDLVIWKDSP